MDDFQEGINKSQLMVHIGANSLSFLMQALQIFIFEMKYGGKTTLHGKLKELQGQRFTKESEFVALHKKGDGTHNKLVDITTEVANEDLLIKVCKEYGLDCCLQRRPDDLEQIFAKYKAGGEINHREQRLMTAFTYKDTNGEIRLKDSKVMFSFCENDINTLELCVDEVFKRSQTNSMEMLKRKAKQYLREQERKRMASSVEPLAPVKERG